MHVEPKEEEEVPLDFDPSKVDKVTFLSAPCKLSCLGVRDRSKAGETFTSCRECSCHL